MIDKNLIHINYIKKEPQTGSYEGMRFLLRKGKNDEGDCMDVYIWPEPYCFVKTDDSQKIRKQFPLTAEGRDEAVDWLNEQYVSLYERWKG